MKREHSNLPPYPDPSSASVAAAATPAFAAAPSSGYSYSTTMSAAVNGKGWTQLADDGAGGNDELLAVLGYKVRTSDMAEVAQKLEQLEEVMGHVQEDGLSLLASDTVHYNPSDLSTWLGSMLSELNPNTSSDPVSAAATASLQPPSYLEDSFLAPAESSTITTVDFAEQQPTNRRSGAAIFEESSLLSDCDLKAIPGKAILNQEARIDSCRDPKRMKHASDSTESTRPVVLVDSQENGIRLVHLLMACAEAVQENKLNLAEALVNQIVLLAVSQAGAMRKVATYFADALARRIYRVCPQSPVDHSLSNILQSHFYESSPYLKFAHFTANQAILEAFEGKKRVHVIDFSMNQGMQWPVLMQALALRPGGPPAFRLTGIGPPSHDNTDRLQEVGWRLARLAETIHVEFEYRGFVANSLADLEAPMLQLRPAELESIAVNSVFELHKLLARPGAIEKVLSVVKQMKPEIVTVVEQEANHNGSIFLDRFTESLHYYSTLFDSLEGSVNTQDKAMSEVYLGKQICNIVACEGTDRVERQETLAQWRTRLGSAGFVPVHLGSNAFKQAAMLPALFAGGDGYTVEENSGCLMLGWHTRPLIATSAWRLANRPVAAH